MDLNAVMTFVTVVEEGSFTAAARTLGMRKSTVSRRIAALEEELDVRLLQRTTRSLRLTAEGDLYYRRCTRAVGELREATAAVKDMRAEPQGTLRVTAPLEFGVRFMSDVIAKVLDRWPLLSVEMVLTARLVDLVAEGFDLAIRPGPLAQSTLIARRLGAAQQVLCASPAYVEAHGHPSHPEELAEHPCLIFFNRGDRVGALGATWTLSRKGHVHSVDVSGRLAINSFALMRQMAIKGRGIARMPLIFARDDMLAGRLISVLDPWTETSATPIYAVYPSREHIPLRLIAFLDALEEEMTPLQGVEAHR